MTPPHRASQPGRLSGTSRSTLRPRLFRTALAFAALTLLVTLAGIPTVAAAEQAVQVTDGAFSPITLTVTQGDVVTWTNKGAMRHTVTADDGSFDSGPLSPGDVFGNLFNAPGTFTYHDALDPTKKGTVIVTAAKPTPTAHGTPAPTPPPGTLPPDFKTPPALPTPTESSTAGSVPTVSPTGVSGPSGTGSDGQERPIALLVASVAAGIAALGFWILGRRQDGPRG